MSSLAIKCTFVLYTYSTLMRRRYMTNTSSDVLGGFSLMLCIIKPVGAWNKSATLQNTLLNSDEKRVYLAFVCEFSVSEFMRGELKAYPMPQQELQCNPPCHHLLAPYHFLPLSHILFFFFPLPALIISSRLPLVAVSCSDPPALSSKPSFYLHFHICLSFLNRFSSSGLAGVGLKRNKSQMHSTYTRWSYLERILFDYIFVELWLVSFKCQKEISWWIVTVCWHLESTEPYIWFFVKT